MTRMRNQMPTRAPATILADFRTELDLENVAGTTAAGLQQDIEDNPMSGELASWEDVKTMYDDRP